MSQKNKKTFVAVLAIIPFLPFAFLKVRAQTIPTINVKNAPYGAKGDGVTDDTAAIQAASEAAFSAGGGANGQGATVYFPNGKYIVRSVKIRPNVSYKGESRENTIIQRPPASIKGGEIVAITRDNPAQLTTSQPHGLSNGSIIFFSGIEQSGWTKMNATRSAGSFITRKKDDNSIYLYDMEKLATGVDAITKGTQTKFAEKYPHKLETGDKITFFNITQSGWTALNGNSYPIDKIDGYNFTINFDSSAFGDYNAATDPGIHYANFDATSFAEDYLQSDPGTVRLEEKSLRTFTTGGATYSSDIDSGLLSIENFTFDGNSAGWGPYQNWQQEQAALLFLSADGAKNGRLKAKVENCNFRNGIGDAILTYYCVDIAVNNVLAENVFRGGFVMSGDNTANNRASLKNFTTRGDIDRTGIDVEPDSPETDGIRPSEIYMENLNIENGDFDIAVESGTKATGKNIIAHAPIYMSGGNGIIDYVDSTFYFGTNEEKNRIIGPGSSMTFDNCKFFATEEDAVGEEDRTLGVYVHWYGGKNQNLTFNGCSFDVDESVEDSDTTYAIGSTLSTLEDGNYVRVNNSSISDKFDLGINSLQFGEKWKVENSYIGAKAPVKLLGYKHSTYGNTFFNTFFNGNIFGQGYGYIMGYNSGTEQNIIENKNFQINQSANKIYSRYGLDGNTYSGSRLVLGDNPPTANTNCLINDIYRLKNPVSGQAHEWKCAENGYLNVNDSFAVTGTNPAVWQAQPVLSAIASLSNLPESPSSSSSASIGVAGTGITHYKYKLDSGSWSAETAVFTPINLTGLANGSHTVSVIGKNAGGGREPQERATTNTWLILGGSITPPPTPTFSKADLNQDGSVNSADLDILKPDFLRLTASLANPRSDINADGQCTARDLGILMSGWGK